MKLNSLTIENFRSFQGSHSINLQTKKNLPIVMFAGLNGAGKTSILTAIKLGLFGKASLKGHITNKTYSSYMQEQINKDSLNVNFASVSIDFDYLKRGKNYRYLVDRSWKVIQNKLTESLVIYENNEVISGLNLDQAQSFIFDLIPLGVADLFFFDGEMVGDMANDQDGKTLIDALKKLVGADLIEKAAFDTAVVLRNHKKNSASIKQKNFISNLEEDLNRTEKRIEEMNNEYSNSYLPKQAELLIKLRNARQKLNESGGAWSKSRDKLIADQGSITERKKEVESKITELIRGNIIFSVAPSFSKNLLLKLNKDLALTKSLDFNNQIDKRLSELKVKDKALNSFANQLKESQIETPKYQISSFQLAHINESITRSKQSKIDLSLLLNEHDSIESKLDELGLNISRAPNEEDLKNTYKNINSIEIEIEKFNHQDRVFKSEIREHLNNAIRLTYDLDKAYEKIQIEESIEKIENLGHKSIQAMNQLSKDLIQEKINALEIEFNKAFQRLIRKNDMAHLLRINRENFNIEMLDHSGKVLNKKNISSGEKQIYAFSMLESLGKVSGRSLPFIIDTPLGRLDSYHRMKLIENFFPKIGEQVIILSTDTEINSTLYDLLAPYISHSNKIIYDQAKSSSSIESGYFESKDNKEKEIELLA